MNVAGRVNWLYKEEMVICLYRQTDDPVNLLKDTFLSAHIFYIHGHMHRKITHQLVRAP